MRNISGDRTLLKLILLLTLLSSPIRGLAQRYEIGTYKIRVLLDSGERINGVLSGVSESTLYFEDKRRDIIKIPLTSIRKVKLIDVNNVRSRIITGAILGALAGGYASYQGNNHSPGNSRSPILLGVTIAFGAAGGAGFGALIGKFSASIGRARFTFRSVGDPESVTRLYHLLEPFSETFQKDVIKQYP
ncbi:LSm family protein [Spirosoma litoris]